MVEPAPSAETPQATCLLKPINMPGEPATLTPRDRQICDAIGSRLREAGQVFVGIDVIGDYLTEVNVTSPTCIHEINAFDGIQIEALLHDAVDARLAAG